MSLFRPKPSWSEARAVLRRECAIPRIPPMVRASALARARAALPARRWEGPLVPTVAVPSRRRAVAFALGCLVSAAIGAAAFELRVRLAPGERVRPATPNFPVVAPSVTSKAMSVGDIDEMRVVHAEKKTKARRSRGDTVAAELYLLKQARAAAARGDFVGALRPITEHAHQFPNGRLSEERDALRVKALAQVGRNDEARSAAAAFQTRYPRSVLASEIRRISVLDSSTP